jgi:hypothetical protein
LRCISRTCHATAHTSVDYIINLQSFKLLRSNNHKNDTIKTLKRTKINEMKMLFKRNIGSISCRDVYAVVMRGTDLAGITAVGRYETVSRMLRNYKKKLITLSCMNIH